ncbi:ras-associating and dilute domain-containing protein isoform X2 [Salminus brasiliensis]|uniref:ras-associating and dilute domain-containing protein isoform X2 n=1 Tax=Salminus brasiliensis TaxID=930266 RepID=UPI003B832482
MISSEGVLMPSRSHPPSPAGISLHAAAQRSFSKARRKQSNGSSSSSGTARSAESVGIRQPAKSKIRRHQHRLSSVFNRGMLRARGEMASAGEEPAVTDDPSELSNHVTAPGILKIFGNEICEGANYKSVLATTHSSAKELVKEALERYSLSKAEADAYVLCDVIGRISEQEWRTECVRVVGDNERPLLLQSLWKPREGYARRFEIQRRATVEEKCSRDKDTVTAGINAQARKLQKTRSRGRSMALVGGVLESGLWRSRSEADLRADSQGQHGSSPEPQNGLKNQSQGEKSGPHKALHCPVGEKKETESNDDNSTQYSIHPPLHFPYFLLLQGFSYTQDFIIYSLSGGSTVFGRCEGVKLWAPDIKQQHCSVQRLETGPASDPDQELKREVLVTVLTPLHGAAVKRNGAIIREKTELRSGDIIGLGDHYVFMFKDPATERLKSDPPAAALPWLAQATQPPPPLCKSCVLSVSEGPLNTLPCLRDAGGRGLILAYEVEHEERILKEIFTRADSHDGAHKVTPSFLLCLCLQQSATHFPMTDLRRLLLHIANEVQVAVWEKAKELAAVQPEGGDDADPVELVSTEKLLDGLQPLVLWMANSIELLHFIHQEVPRLLHGISREEEEEEEDCMAVLELRLSTVRPASEEAMTVLEEVIMFTFQQCVYYLTKLLYPVLPGLLDSNPFSENGQVRVPEAVGSVLAIFTKTLNLVKDFHVHPEISLQLFTYLFFFINAFLFNLLMERGSGGNFYHWSCGVQIRANLDLLMDWAYAAGLGELAQNYLIKLSSAVNLLAMPRENLLQASWASLRVEFASLSPAQLHHMLREYSPRQSCPSTWMPSSDEAKAAVHTADILESFDDHPPLVLPIDGFLLDLKRPIRETSLIKQLTQLQTILKKVQDPEPNKQTSQSESAVPLEAKRTKMEVLPKAHLEPGHTEVVLPKKGVPAYSTGPGHLGTSEALLTQKLKALELQAKQTNYNGSNRRLALDPSCLLTPPNTPQSVDLLESEAECQYPGPNHQTAQCGDTLKQEEGGCETHDVGNDEVFVLELQKGAGGLGLALVDGMETPLQISGIYIKSILPGSPAALSQKLRPGDRILAVNGHRLVGVDYHIGRELIQKSGDRPQLLLSRTEPGYTDKMPKH